MRSCETFKKEGALQNLALISPLSFLKVSQLRMHAFANMGGLYPALFCILRFFLSQRLSASVLLNSAFSKNFNEHVNKSRHWKCLKYNDEFHQLFLNYKLYTSVYLLLR